MFNRLTAALAEKDEDVEIQKIPNPYLPHHYVQVKALLTHI